MEVKACRICKRLFHDYVGYEICPECLKNNENQIDKIKEKSLLNKQRFMAILTSKAESDDKGYEEVREYIVTHPKATIIQVSTATRVSPNTIINWVREEKLEFSDESKYAWFRCELCGTKIPSGRLCYRCR